MRLLFWRKPKRADISEDNCAGLAALKLIGGAAQASLAMLWGCPLGIG
jgi:hypothetical protein